ncbi:MAG: hypothetical protein Q9216_000274 [Gyalolechia sp. 2 TL-2023]
MSNESSNHTISSRNPRPPAASASTSSSFIFNSLPSFGMPNLPNFRFPGDGFDFRRPAPPSAAPRVIDLTDDNGPNEAQPQPRQNTRSSGTSNLLYSRERNRNFSNFIDLEDESTGAPFDGASQSPDLELLEVRSVRSQPADNTEQLRRQETRHPRANLRLPSSSHAQAHPFSVGHVGGWGALRQHAQGRERQQHLAQQTARHFHQLLHSNHPHQTADVLLRHDGSDIILPGELDFVTQGFRMGEDTGPRQAQPPLPTYDAPSPPRSGFTRSPKEDDVLVCPNCEDELGLGKDDVKRQVWVIKACGHVRASVLSPLGIS